jgi:hypothetical protein
MSSFPDTLPTTITCSSLYNQNVQGLLPTQDPADSPKPFRYAPTDHEEPSHLALSDDEGATFAYDPEAESSSSEGHNGTGMTAQQTRFLICMRAYLGLSFVEIAKAANAVFGKGRNRGKTWKKITKEGVRVGLVMSQDDEYFENYWQALDEARRKLREPKGLSEEELREAREWLGKVKRVNE